MLLWCLSFLHVNIEPLHISLLITTMRKVELIDLQLEDGDWQASYFSLIDLPCAIVSMLYKTSLQNVIR